mmetsp:Transcript_81112/g.173490  ORF Transcript_81112/g.173490 Transcript_81112/m.173490 type:complete len:211 (-) Transcript_81112:8-640(-)
MESCAKPAAIMSARTDAEEGHLTFLFPKRFLRKPLAPPPAPWEVGSFSSSVTSCCTFSTSALTSAEVSAPRVSSRSLIVATWKGEVCVNLSTWNLDCPSIESVMTLTSWSPTFVELCACEAMRQYVPTLYSSSESFASVFMATTPMCVLSCFSQNSHSSEKTCGWIVTFVRMAGNTTCWRRLRMNTSFRTAIEKPANARMVSTAGLSHHS